MGTASLTLKTVSTKLITSWRLFLSLMKCLALFRKLAFVVIGHQ